MAKSRTNGDESEFTFEQLELALESAIGIENDERTTAAANEARVNACAAHNRCNNSVHNTQQSTQRTRNHYCHSSHNISHQSSHHLPHQSQHNHHHNHHRNSHHYNQELARNVMNDESQHYTLDQSEFERVWRHLDTDKDKYNFLRSLYRATPSGALVFSEISFGSLGDIAAALSEFDDTVYDFCFVVYMLSTLSRAKRFLLSLQFLTADERQECKRLFHKLWRSMSDKQQDLAENDITELTINELMRLYEVDN